MTVNKKTNPILYQIHQWILKVESEGWGEIEFTIKSHDYVVRLINMTAVNPKKKTLPKSITKKLVIKK